MGAFVCWNKGSMAKIKVQVFGKVQGVCFRHNARMHAQPLCLTGWVKNLSDGSVLCEAAGEKDALLEFIDWCKQGPEGAIVKNVSIEWLQDETPSLTGFSIID
jgi:acylphosphatase